MVWSVRLWLSFQVGSTSAPPTVTTPHSRSAFFEPHGSSQTELVVRIDYKLNTVCIKLSVVVCKINLGSCIGHMADAYQYLHVIYA
jgi:hypothetical protein